MSTRSKYSCTRLLIVSAALHIAFLAVGFQQDKAATFKYTDIDYEIYNGGAEGILHRPIEAVPELTALDTFMTRASPYRRSTYRYSPFMALIVLPNIWLGPLFGKLLFCTFNLATGWVMHKILEHRQVEEKTSKILISLWLFNPLAIQVATRGNADAIMTFLVLALLYHVLKKKALTAGVCLGCAIHIRIYPVIYALPLLMTWNDTCTLANMKEDLVGHINVLREAQELSLSNVLKGSIILSLQLIIAPWRFLYRFVTRLNQDQWFFGLSAMLTFFAMTLSCYSKYGWTFLFETYLYHFVRHDHRHNFSPFSAWASLVTPRRDPTEEIRDQFGGMTHFKAVQKLSQLPLTCILGFWFIQTHPALSLFLQTTWFVVFNGVSTAQYFVWYLALLPLALASSKRVQHGIQLKALWTHLTIIAFLYIIADLNWVYWSHRFEFLGEVDAFLGLFIATLSFSAVCVLLMIFVLSWCRNEENTDRKRA